MAALLISSITHLRVWLQTVASVGFVNTDASDKTDLFVDVLKRELQRLADIKDEFISVSELHSVSSGSGGCRGMIGFFIIAK